MNKLLAIVGGSTLVYASLAMLMGVLPGITLSNTPPGPGVEPLTPLQAEGREVYIANGCSYCHTQQVRPLAQDKVFGRPSAPGDFAYQTPELLGSARIGPDLTNIGARQPSEVWQYIHLYNPRAVVAESVMPSFDWLFDVVDKAPQGVTAVPLPKDFAPVQGVVVPSRKAQALLAYLLSLKQPALPGGAGETVAMAAGAAPAGGTATPSTTGATAATAAPATTAATGSQDSAKGEALFVSNCAACHQASGEGLPGAFPPLKGNVAVNDADPTKHISVILHGLQGAVVDGVTYASPMPPFADTLADADIAAIVNHERASWGNQGAKVTATQVAAERARKK
ncbi:MAG: cbb3-type cytochrome c oxidase subunit II [Burkholderiales bacterium]